MVGSIEISGSNNQQEQMGKPRKHLATFQPENSEDDSEDDSEQNEESAVSTALLEGPPPAFKPDPKSPVWTIKLYRRTSSDQSASGTWSLLHTFHGECWSDWYPDYPIDRVRRQWKNGGEFRYDVLYLSKPAPMDDYPGMKGPRIFYVDDGQDTGTVAPPAPAAPPVPPTPTGQDNLTNTLLQHALNGGRQHAPAAPFVDPWPTIQAMQTAIGELKTELHAAKAAREAEKERIAEARVAASEKAAEERAAAAERRAEERAAVSAERQQVLARVDKLDSRVEALEKRDPLAEIERIKRSADALGMEPSGVMGVAKEGLTVLRDVIAQGRNQQQPQLTDAAATAAGGAPPQQQQQQPAQQTPHWHTFDGGAWKRLGDLVFWIGGHIEKQNYLTTDHICTEALSVLSQSDVDCRWLCECSAEDVRKLFAFVFGEVHPLMAHWQAIVKAVQQVLIGFPVFLANYYTEREVKLPDWLIAALRAKGHVQPPAPKAPAPPRAPQPPTNGTANAGTSGQQPTTATGNPAASTAPAGANAAPAADAGPVDGGNRTAGAEGGN